MQTSGQAECGRPQNPTQSVSLGSPLPTRLKQFLLTSFLVLSLKLHLLPSAPRSRVGCRSKPPLWC